MRWAYAVIVALSGAFTCNAQAAADADEPARSLRVISGDVAHVKGSRDSAYRLCVGAGHAALMLSSGNQAQLAQVHRELGFQFVRFHGIFTDDMHVYNEAGNSVTYDWSKIDALYDDLMKIGIKPFVELSFMPKALASGAQEIFYWHANVTPPKDMTRWSAFVEAFVRHLQQRYGASEIATWYFEVWNEPNYPGFWPGADQGKYFALYDATAAAIKLVNPALRVGGPATAGAGWVPEFLAHTQAANVPVDFVSTHTYAVTSGFLDADGNADLVLSAATDAISGDVLKVHDQILHSTTPRLPLMMTEWSASYSSRDPVHDSYTSAAFVLDTLKRTEGAATAMSYWTYSDLFEENGPPPAAFHGGFGLLTRDELPKATYFAYKYLNALDEMELNDSDPDSWLTVSKDRRHLSALLWNKTALPQTEGNKSFYRRLHPSARVPAVELRLSGLQAGAYRVKIFRTGYQANDAYSAYIEMGSPKDLSHTQLNDLRNKTQDKPELDTILQVRKGTASVGNRGAVLQHWIPMRENDVVLVSIKRTTQK